MTFRKDILNFNQRQLYFQCFSNDCLGYKTGSQENVCNPKTLDICTKPNLLKQTYTQTPSYNTVYSALALSDLYAIFC